MFVQQLHKGLVTRNFKTLITVTKPIAEKDQIIGPGLFQDSTIRNSFYNTIYAAEDFLICLITFNQITELVITSFKI